MQWKRAKGALAETTGCCCCPGAGGHLQLCWGWRTHRREDHQGTPQWLTHLLGDAALLHEGGAAQREAEQRAAVMRAHVTPKGDVGLKLVSVCVQDGRLYKFDPLAGVC